MASTSQPTADFTPEGAELQTEKYALALSGEPPFAKTPPDRNLVRDSLRDAVIAAIIALALFGPLVGLETTPLANGLGVIPRWTDVAILVAIVFVRIFYQIVVIFFFLLFLDAWVKQLGVEVVVQRLAKFG